MKVVITGAGGQLGRAVAHSLSRKCRLYPLTRRELDICDLQQTDDQIRKIKPDVVVNAAAYTSVDEAEKQPEQAYLTNAFGARNVALAAKAVNAKLIHISTDYVFDGSGRPPYAEWDPVRPLNVYGKTKHLGEDFIRIFGERFFILRTSWLYGESGGNFVVKIIRRMMKERKVYAAVDQIGSPTYTRDLADHLHYFMHSERYGVYHAANRGSCSRFSLVKAIKDRMGMDDIRLVPVNRTYFKLPAARPANTALDDAASRLNGYPRMRGWREALHDFLDHHSF